jgi:hypothetical protein
MWSGIRFDFVSCTAKRESKCMRIPEHDVLRVISKSISTVEAAWRALLFKGPAGSGKERTK